MTFGIVAGIVALIAAGCLVAYTIILTFKWLFNKIEEKLAARNAKKVIVADLKKLSDDYDNKNNKMSLGELKDYVEQKGYTHAIVTVDDSDEVSDLEMIKDINNILDQEVEEFINRTGEGVVVIKG